MTLKVASATFVGRVRELEHVASRLDAATGGPASIFLISGEAGVGKTRFLDEVAGRARARGVRVMEGGCVQLGVEGLPFGPIIEALRDLPDIFSPAVLDDLLGSGRTDLARLMPRLQGTTVRPVGRDGGLSSPGRLFEQFLLLLHRLGGQGPVLLAIEDIHWADASTLDLLMFLVRNLRSPVGLIATYRSDEISRTHPLVPVLATLIRSGRVERIELARFSPAEVLEQISAILGRAPDEETAEDVLTRSEGNAFYVEELLASLGDGRGLPSTLREVLIERYATLGVRARELVRTAAAAGADVRLDLLAAVMDADEATVAEALHDAIERQILVPRSGAIERYAFRHALVREAVYGELLPSERTRIHARFAEGLAARETDAHDPASPAELAYHWHAAHHLPQALEASIRAGLAAESLFANRDARTSYERALELWDRVPDAAERSPIDRVDLLTRAAITTFPSAPHRAAAYARQAIDQVDPSIDPPRAGLVHSYLGALLLVRDDEAALAAAYEGFRMIPPEPPTPERARAGASLGSVLAAVDRHREALAVLEDASATLARVSAHPSDPVRRQEWVGIDPVAPERVANLILEQRGRSLAALGHVTEGIVLLHRARVEAIDLGLVSRAAETWLWETSMLLEAGRLEEAVTCYRAGSAYASEHGLASRYIYFFGVDALFALGRWTEAAEVLDSADLDPPRIEAPFLDGRRAQMDVGQGRFGDAARLLRRHQQLVVQSRIPTILAPFVCAGAELAIWDGDAHTAAVQTLDRLPAIEAAPDVWVGHLAPVYAVGLRAQADLTTLARSRKLTGGTESADAAASDLLERMRRLARKVASESPVYSPQADAWLALCEAESLRGDGRVEPDAWSMVAADWARLGMPYQRAYALMREAQAHVSGLRHREEGASVARAAFAIANGLGAVPLRSKLAEIAGRAGVHLEPSAHPSGSAAGASGEPARRRRNGTRRSLTARELEVLELLVAGNTDGEIAATLFISRKTVSVHVANIKSKLGAESRVEIVTSAIRRGIVETRTDD